MSIPAGVRAAILAAALFFLPQAAGAAGGSTGAAGHAAAAAAPALTPAEAEQLLGVLNDPARRAAFVATLNNMAKAVHAQQAASHVPAALPPNSLGAEIILGFDGMMRGVAVQGLQYERAARQFRDLGPWLARATRTPEQREAVTGALARLVAVLALSLAAVALANILIRRPVRGLARIAGGRPPPPPAPEDGVLEEGAAGDAAAAEEGGPEPATMAGAMPLGIAAGEGGETPAGGIVAEAAPARRVRARHRIGLLRMLHALRRIPFALLHLLLQLVPVLLFALTAFACGVTGLIQPGESVTIVQAALHSFVLAGLVIAVVQALLAPQAPALRLVLISDRVAERCASSLRLMALVAAWGFAVIDVLENLGLGADTVAALTKTLVLALHAILAVLFFRIRREVARRLRPPRRVAGDGRTVLRRLADRWWLFAVFFDFAFWLVWAAELRHGYARLWTFTVDTVLVVAAARIVAVVLLGQVERAFRVDPEAAARHPWFASRSERYYPVLRQLVTAVIGAAMGVVLLQIWGLGALDWFRRGALGSRLVSALIGIGAAFVTGVLVWELTNAALERHVERLAAGGENAARVARVRTLMPMLRIMLMIFIGTVLALTVLSEIGVNIAPLLGGAGIIGVAIGFGSQKLVQDFITGIFLLLENTMQVGDWVTLAGLSGSVEHLSIRTIRLRAGDGSLHTVPFSSVTTVNNTNRGLGNAAVSVDVDPAEDTDRVAAVLHAVAGELRADPAFAPGMISDLQLWGVTAVSSQAVTLQGQIVCTDSGRWGVQREFNRRLRMRLAESGIRLAAPTHNVVFAHAAPRPGPAAAAADEDASAADLAHSPPPAAIGHDR